MLDILEPGQDKRSPVVGIDLGTTHSLVAHSAGGDVCIFEGPNFKNRLMPSVLSYINEGEVRYGYYALEDLAVNPSAVVSSVKRLMGRGLSDSAQYADSVSFELSGSDEMVYLHPAGIKKTPVEISADLLKALKTRAERALEESVYDAVITVPAYFNDAQRQATKDAAKLAGLNVMRLLSEPTAAALAYGLDKKAEGVFMVYDLGGGTFDVSVLRLMGGVFKVVATAGDTELGGDDIDHAIASHLNIDTVTARSLKEQLSYTEEMNGFTREELEKITDPFVGRTLDICMKALSDANLKQTELNGIVMVGGSTKMPYVSQQVSRAFSIEPEQGIDPDSVVAHGAAIQAASLSGESHDDMLLLDVTPLSLGLETMGGLVEKVIHRNTPIPITRAQKFTTFKDGQNAMDIHVLQGERETVDECRSLAKFKLSGIPALPAGMARIKVIFALDADGLLNVTAEEETTAVRQTVDVVPSYGLKEDEVLSMLKASVLNARSDVEERMLREARLELERVYDACYNALKIDGSILNESDLLTHENALSDAKIVLNESDKKEEVEDAMRALESVFQTFSENRVNVALKKAVVGTQI